MQLLNANNEGIASYNPLSLQPQIISIAIVLIILASIYIAYYFKLKKVKVDEAPKGLVLIIQIFINWMRGLVLEILGPKFEKATPYFLFLFSYILFSNLIGILGIANPTASLTVTLSLGFVTWITIFVVGIKFQKLSFFKKFFIKIKINDKSIPLMINPLEIVASITPLISISFRLWGNIFAGGLIITLWFFFISFITSAVPAFAIINILAGLTAPPIHGYFDLLCGTIQALVFTLLTMVYWTLEQGEELIQTKQEFKKITKLDIANIK